MKKPLLFILATILFSHLAQAQNVGVGTASPGTKLDINGAITLREGSVLIGTGATSGTILDGYSQILVTGSPGGAFTLSGPSTPANAGQKLVIYNNTTGGYAGTFTAAGTSIPNGTAVEFIYSTGNWVATSPTSGSGSYIQNQTSSDQTAGFRINGNGLFNGGKVGIGTTLPLSLLTISTPTITLSNANTYPLGIQKSGNTDFTIGSDGSIATYMQSWNNRPLLINSQGNSVGIGMTTAPVSKLDVSGGVTIGSAYSGTNPAPSDGAIIQGQVGIGTTSPNASAILDISSTTKGFLPPRMTTAQELAIVSPANGLLVFNSSTKCLDMYSSSTSTWESVYCSCPALPTLSAISGLSQVCYTSNNTYTVPSIQGASNYAWSVTGSPTITGNGTNTISFTPGAALTSYVVSVTATNACGSSPQSTSTTVNEFTGAPGTPAWSGTAPAAAVCTGASSVGYTITSGIGVNGTSAQTYTWTFTATGAGTTATIVSTGQTIAVGSPVTITGASPLSYALNYGSTSGGSITVSVVGNNLCGTSSTPLSQTVSIAAQPSLTAVTPAAQVVCASASIGPASISTTNSGGTGTITYQWFTSASAGVNTGGTTLGSTNGANTTTYTRPATVTTGTTYFYMTMTATGAGCTAYTTPVNNASIQVTAQPSLTAPANGGQTVCTTGQIGTALTATPAGGTGVGTVYQWYSAGAATPASGGTSLGAGAQTLSYTPAAASSAGTTYFYLTFSTTGLGCVTATSLTNNASVITVAQPTIANPTAINECIGSTTAFTAAGSNGAGTGTYTWYTNGSSNSNSGGTGASGATNSSSYTPSSASAGTTYYYATYGTSGAGCTTSAPTLATSVVINAPPTLTTTPLTAAAVCYYIGGALTTSATYAATTNSPNQYNINWTGFANQGTTSFAFASGGGSLNTITVPASTAAGTYTGNLIITNTTTTCSTTYTNGISVTVNAALAGGAISGYTTVGSKQQSVIYTTTSGQSGYVWSSSGGTLASALANGANTTTASWPLTNSYGGNGGAYNTTVSVAYNTASCTYTSSLGITVGGNYTTTVANASGSPVVWPSSTTGWGVTTYFAQLWGGGGGGGDYGNGGGGGYVEGTITAPVGQTFNTWVGGGGGAGVSAAAGGIGYGTGGASGVMTAGNPAGAGGGATAIGVTASVLAVAGGGGGGGSVTNSTTSKYGQGGGGGNAAAGGGGLDSYSGNSGNSGSNSAGGRTSSAGAGAAGYFSTCGCTTGVAASGHNGGSGNTTSVTYAGGGGGGGFYGGGGGSGNSATGNSLGGGGGGSSLFASYNSGGITFTNGANTIAGLTSGAATLPNSYINPGYTGTNWNSSAGQGGNYSVVGVAGINGLIYIGY